MRPSGPYSAIRAHFVTTIPLLKAEGARRWTIVPFVTEDQQGQAERDCRPCSANQMVGESNRRRRSIGRLVPGPDAQITFQEIGCLVDFTGQLGRQSLVKFH